MMLFLPVLLACAPKNGPAAPEETDTDTVASTDTDVGPTDPTDRESRPPNPACDGPQKRYTGRVVFEGFAADLDMKAFCGDGYTEIRGDLDVQNVVSLADLDCLCTVTDEVRVQTWGSTFDGLTHLRTVGGNFIVEASHMTDIDGWDALEEVNGREFLISGDSLTDISGFPRLRVVDATRMAFDTPALEDISGFNAIEKRAADGLAFASPEQRDMSGFNGLKRTWGLRFVAADSLEQVTGLQGGVIIDNDLEISSNPELTDVSFLSRIKRIDGDLKIRLNPKLSTRHISEMVGQLGTENIAGSVVIEDNLIP